MLRYGHSASIALYRPCTRTSRSSVAKSLETRLQRQGEVDRVSTCRFPPITVFYFLLTHQLKAGLKM